MGAESGTAMESKVIEDSLSSALSSSHGDAEPKLDASPEEIITILEVIAATGKFWHDWEGLKNMLSFQLKLVLADYPEARIGSGTELQQSTLSGKTYLELVKRLDEALLGFIEGPPFTLQRLCEILLNPKSTYLSLSKLALALEKNLLVTSTLTRCTDDPYPSNPTKKPPEADKILHEEPHDPSEEDTASNGVGNDVDEEMVDAEEADDGEEEDPASKDTEMKEDRAEEEDSTENLEIPSSASTEHPHNS